MARRNWRELARGFLSSLAFIAAGGFALWADAPALVAWPCVVIGALGFALVAYRVFRPMKLDDASRVTLRDGRDYRVDVTGERFVLTHKASNDARAVAWNDVTYVAIIAIDNFPVGGISFMIHDGAGPVEVPWDVEGSREFLNAMQEKLPGFDDMAVVESASMLHGFRQVWPAEGAAARSRA